MFRFLKDFSATSLVCLAILSCTANPGVAQQPNPPANNDDRDLAIKLYNQSDTKGAISKLRSAAKKTKDPEVWYYLGLALIRNDQFKEAGKAFESALKLQPDLAKARAGLAFTLFLRNQLRDALSEAERALASNPNLVDAHYIVGAVRLRTGEAAKALDKANASIRLSPNFARGYLLKSQALVALSDESASKEMSREQMLATYKDAVASLEKYLRLSADNATDAFWREQLEALKSTADLFEQTGRTILRSSEVTERVRVLSKPEPAYTDLARQHGLNGTVVLRAVFAADGKVKHISVMAALPDGLTERAMDAARRIRFVPAKKDGRPVSMWMQLEYNFNLY